MVAKSIATLALGLCLAGCRSPSPRLENDAGALPAVAAPRPSPATTSASASSAPAAAQASAPSPGELDSPAHAWNALLSAMDGGDVAAVHALSTTPDTGCLPLDELAAPKADRAARLREVAAAWRKEPVEWGHSSADQIVGTLGLPKPAMTAVCFRRVAGQWRCSGYRPGD